MVQLSVPSIQSHSRLRAATLLLSDLVCQLVCRADTSASSCRESERRQQGRHQHVRSTLVDVDGASLLAAALHDQ